MTTKDDLIKMLSEHATHQAAEAPEWRDDDTVTINVSIGDLRSATTLANEEPASSSASARVSIVDNDVDEIRAEQNGTPIRSWVYRDRDEQKVKMRMAREFAEGVFVAGKPEQPEAQTWLLSIAPAGDERYAQGDLAPHVAIWLNKNPTETTVSERVNAYYLHQSPEKSTFDLTKEAEDWASAFTSGVRHSRPGTTVTVQISPMNWAHPSADQSAPAAPAGP